MVTVMSHLRNQLLNMNEFWRHKVVGGKQVLSVITPVVPHIEKKELLFLKSNRLNLCVAPSNTTVKYLHLVVLISTPRSC